jgi:hypothetical protein
MLVLQVKIKILILNMLIFIQFSVHNFCTESTLDCTVDFMTRNILNHKQGPDIRKNGCLYINN